ncbi:MAG: type II/IV secretion system protein [Crocinitomicaceae bacterium]|nr:type II/IV secretion system protein [Crocinitomicaceae bacterium]
MEQITDISISVDLQQLISADMAWNYSVIPAEQNADCLSFYIDETALNDTVKEDLEILTGENIKLIPVESSVLRRSLGKIYRRSGSAVNNKNNQNLGDKDDFLLRIVHEAQSLGSSDIHIEIYEEEARVRIRIDGHLVEKYRVDRDEYPEIVNKVKIKSNLDISEKRLPQDGRINFPEFDLRVSVLPTLHGEKIVLRILARDASQVDLNFLGFDDHEKTEYLEGIKKPNGIVLISGPTGSGKTTTLYATLKILNEEKRNIVTVEDPIEYTLKGINQVQLKENIGLTFSSALRSFLRQDPDIIMLGEIRDGETAQMAIRAALTGHLVLSTIHTNSAWGTIGRMIDMGVPSYLLASTINTSVAQRLVRVLCNDCKEEIELVQTELPKDYRNKGLNTHHVPVGCESCHFTGYKGRKAVYEVINIDHDLSDRIKEQQLKVDELLQEKGIKKLNEKAYNLLSNGVTSLEEVYALLTNI